MEKLSEHIGLLIAWILIYLAKELWVQWRKRKEQAAKANNHSIDSIEEVRNKVSHEEKKILYSFGGMRMFVIHYTNGTETEAGMPLFKVSFHHEVLEDYYVEPIAKHFKTERPIPEMLISPVKHLMHSGRFFIESVEDLKRQIELDLVEDPTNIDNQQRLEHCDWLLSYKVKCVLWLAIKNKNGKKVAIQVIHWPAARAINKADIPKIEDMKKSVEDVYNKYSTK
jgi:hypothetical protein